MSKNIFIELTEEKIDVKELYGKFYAELEDSTGTILIHHGKSKYPGKYKKYYTKINLFLKSDEALKLLTKFSEEIYDKYELNKLFVVHQLGEIGRNDTILFLAIESKDRDRAFKSVREILEFIKSETLIGLEEV